MGDIRNWFSFYNANSKFSFMNIKSNMITNIRCIICNNEIVGYGHSSKPLADGSCCLNCNEELVKPYKLKLLNKKTEQYKLFEI